MTLSPIGPVKSSATSNKSSPLTPLGVRTVGLSNLGLGQTAPVSSFPASLSLQPKGIAMSQEREEMPPGKPRKPRTQKPLPQGVTALLEAVLRNHVDQPDAACVGHHNLFDVARFSDNPVQAAAATTIAARYCHQCPWIECSERLQAVQAPANTHIGRTA